MVVVMRDTDTMTMKNLINSLIIGGLGVISVIYILNPGAGVIELIPDNIPIIGNLDEAAAVTILISCLAYFGVDLGNLFGRKSGSKGKDATEKEKKAVDAEIING